MSKGKILLDAGHYAKRNQSPAVPEYYESERMWMLHRMLQARLELLGFDVAVTREKQAKDLSVTARGKMAEGYDLMLSLHSNAEDSGTVDRVVIYEPVDASDEHTQFALTAAKTISQVMGTSDPSAVKRRANSAGKDYYGVMRGAGDVGCGARFIIEHSFHTNEAAAKFLLKDENLAKLAQAEAELISDFFTGQQPLLVRGSRGSAVERLQRLLNELGAGLAVDGIFGSNTEDAVENFQKEISLKVDGKVGPETWGALLA